LSYGLAAMRLSSVILQMLYRLLSHLLEAFLRVFTPNSLLASQRGLAHRDLVMADTIQALTTEIRAFRDRRRCPNSRGIS
jgi:hypothetical protein